MFVVLVCVFCFGKTPAKVTVCDLYQNAPKYNKQLVEVRGRVGFGFEDFTLSAADCKIKDPSIYDPSEYGGLPSVWLEFGGDIEAPITYCCGSHERKKGADIEVEGIKIPVQWDIELERFVRLVSAKRKRAPNGSDCFQACYFFEVAATITGRFFAGERFDRADGKYFYQGYGHLGCCNLLVIQSVKDVEAERTDVPSGLKYACTHNRWKVDFRTKAQVEQKHADGAHEEWRATEPDRVAAEALKLRMQEWREMKPDAVFTLEQSYGGALHPPYSMWEPYEAVVYLWRSNDQLTRYAVELRRWKKNAGPSQPSVWVPVLAERESCILVK